MVSADDDPILFEDPPPPRRGTGRRVDPREERLAAAIKADSANRYAVLGDFLSHPEALAAARRVKRRTGAWAQTHWETTIRKLGRTQWRVYVRDKRVVAPFDGTAR